MHDNLSEFDLQLRSMLQDAEVKPSRRVWKGISKQLTSAAIEDKSAVLGAQTMSRTKVFSSWYTWAGAGLAFAAVLALALVFLGTNEQIDYIYNPKELRAQNTEIKLLSIEECRPLAEAQRVVRQEIASETKSEETVILKENTAEEKSEPQTSPSSDIDEFLKKYRTFSSDSFDEIDDKPTNYGKTSIYAKGLIGANDSDLQSYKPFASMAPGITETGISELGESSFAIPISLGLGVRFYLAPNLSLATGVDVSLLSRSFAGKYQGQAGNVTHSMVYLGVPVNLYYDIFASDKLKFYAYGGGEIEYCVSNKYTVHLTPKVVETSAVRKPLFSLGAGLGIEYNITRLVGLYLDPGVRYYFPSDHPRSVRTDRPISVSLDAGLRFNF